MAEDTTGLERRLREAGEAELIELVTAHGGEIGPTGALHALRNAHLSRPVVERLLEERRLLASYEVRAELARHPLTPQVRALRLVSGLFWRDLVRMTRDMRVPPVVRRSAERRLVERFDGLSTGERMAIARSCGGGLISRIRHSPCPRTIGALLENPRLAEGMLLPLASNETARPEVLARIAGDRRWGSRYRLRLAICRNPRTPPTTALGILPALKKVDLGSIVADRRIAAPVRRRAELLLGGRH